jgi:Carboxypeptidase regulatory-like domain
MLTVLLAVLVGVQMQSASPPRDSGSATAGTCSIAGRITERGTDRPLFRAIVTLASADRSRQREALTDAQGRYEFTGLQPGDYALSATPGDHRSTHLRQNLGQPDPSDLFAGPAAAVLRLTPGEQRTGADLALTRALAIEGRVLDSSDEPMADVEVQVVGISAVAGVNNQYTDDHGEYRLFGLRPGRYRVCAVGHDGPLPPSSSSRLVRTCYPASAGESAAADAIVGAEDASGIDIHMQRSGTFSVTGSVYDAAGALVEGATVFAMSIVDHATSSNGATVREGRYVLPGLTPGRYYVRASIGGPANPGDTRPPSREQEAGYAMLDVGGADVTGFDLRTAKGASIAGRVVFDEAGAPRPSGLQMMVWLRPSGNGWRFPDRGPSSPVDDNLAFELTRVFRWAHVVGIQGLPQGWVVKSVRYAGRDITDRPTELGAESTPTRLEIHLTKRVATPSVHVTTPDGTPVTSYQVVLLPRDSARWQNAVVGAWLQPSADGVVSLGPRMPGDYLLAALSPNDYRLLVDDAERISSLAPLATPVILVEGESRTFDLQLTKLPAARQ